MHAYARTVVDGWDSRLREVAGRGGGCFAVPIQAARPAPRFLKPEEVTA